MKTIYLNRNRFEYFSLTELREEAEKSNIEIGKNVNIGNGVDIGNNIKIGNCVDIGNNIKIGNCVKIANNITIGNCVKIANNVVIGDNIKIGNGIEIANDVKIGFSVTLENKIKIGNGVRIVNGIEIHKIIEFNSYYKYKASGYINILTGIEYIQLGCFVRTIEEWEADFDNNQYEFAINSKEWEKRKNVYEMIKYCLLNTKF